MSRRSPRQRLTHRRRRAGAVLAILGAALAVASPSAIAAAPDVTLTPINVDFVDRTCSFPLEEHLEGHTVTQRFTNELGAEVRRLSHISVTGTITNPVSHATARVHQAATAERTSEAGTVTATQRGLRLLVTAPGTGRLLIDAGLVVTEAGQVVHVAGHHDLRDRNTAEMCAALS